MAWTPSSAEVYAAECVLADCMCEPSDGYWRATGEAVLVAAHKAHADQMPAALVIDVLGEDDPESVGQAMGITSGPTNPNGPAMEQVDPDTVARYFPDLLETGQGR